MNEIRDIFEALKDNRNGVTASRIDEAAENKKRYRGQEDEAAEDEIEEEEDTEDAKDDTELDEARSLFESARADYIAARNNYRALLEAKEDEDEDGEDVDEEDDEYEDEDMPEDEDEEEVDEKVKKVVRDGKVVKKKVPTHKVILNAKQKAALMKARKKAHTAAANRARKKSNKVRDRKGL